jgi:hypothetical protein
MPPKTTCHVPYILFHADGSTSEKVLRPSLEKLKTFTEETWCNLLRSKMPRKGSFSSWQKFGPWILDNERILFCWVYTVGKKPHSTCYNFDAEHMQQCIFDDMVVIAFAPKPCVTHSNTHHLCADAVKMSLSDATAWRIQCTKQIPPSTDENDDTDDNDDNDVEDEEDAAEDDDANEDEDDPPPVTIENEDEDIEDEDEEEDEDEDEDDEKIGLDDEEEGGEEEDDDDNEPLVEDDECTTTSASVSNSISFAFTQQEFGVDLDLECEGYEYPLDSNVTWTLPCPGSIWK